MAYTPLRSLFFKIKNIKKPQCIASAVDALPPLDLATRPLSHASVALMRRVNHGKTLAALHGDSFAPFAAIARALGAEMPREVVNDVVAGALRVLSERQISAHDDATRVAAVECIVALARVGWGKKVFFFFFSLKISNPHTCIFRAKPNSLPPPPPPNPHHF
jgi:hypothetical protein